MSCSLGAVAVGLWLSGAIIQGIVRDQATAEPLSRARVAIAGAAHETVTAADGSFRLENVPVGEQTLVASTVGYRLVRRRIRIAEGEMHEVEILLGQEAATVRETVTVTAPVFEEVDRSGPSQHTLNGTELENLSSVLVDDPYRSVQALPGVATNDDFHAAYSVRGGDPRSNGVEIDGVVTHNLVHTVAGTRESTGSVAVLNGDLVENLALYPSAFSARYGDRTASYLDVATREGSRDRVHGRAAASGTAASLLGEGPLGRSRRGSWIVAARKTYLEYLVDRLSPEDGVAIGFADVHARADWDPTPRSRATASFLWGRADLHRDPRNRGVTSLIDGGTRHVVGSTAWSYSPNARLLWQTRVYAMRETYRNRNRDADLLARGRYRDAALRSDVAVELAGNHRLEAGVLIRSITDRILDRRYDFAERRFLEFDSIATRYRHDAVYVQDRWTIGPGHVAVTLGARGERLGLTGQAILDPRASAEWRISGYDRLDAGWGTYSQFPDALPVAGRNGRADLRAEVARHAVVGYERLLGLHSRVRVELYSRKESNLLRAPGSLFQLVDGRVRVPDVDFRWDNALRARTRGVEVSVQRRSANGLSGWISYAYQRSRAHDLGTEERYAGDYDQRHTANLYGSYRFTARWNLSGKARFGSGFPYPGYLEARGDAFFLARERNAVRLPHYARVDARVNRAFHFDRGKLTVYFEVMNLTNRRNLRYETTFGVNATTRRVSLGRDRLFPILPSAGLVLEF